MQQNESFTKVLQNPGFLNLWLNQVLVQLSYNSLNFALIIWVFQLTHSNTAISTLLFAVYLPAFLFGLFAGVIVDITDKKKIIMGINICLAILFFSLILFKDSYAAILIIAFLVNSLGQLYSPSESSAIPIVVKKEQLFAANSIFSTTLYVSFLVGFGLAGPLIDHFGINFVFLFGGILLSIAFILSFFFPSIKNKADAEGVKLLKAVESKDFRAIKQIGLIEIQETIKLIRGKLPVLSSLMILAGAQVVVGILAVLIPSFFEKVIHVQATNASYVLIIPLGLGMVAGGLVVGRVGYKFPRRTIVSRAIFYAGSLFFLVGISPIIGLVIKYIQTKPLPFFYQLPISAVMAAGSFLLGMLMVSIIITSQTVLQENTPEEDRGKVFAVLGAAMAGLSIIPVLTVGILADFFGTLPIFVALGLIIMLLGLFGLHPNIFFSKHNLPFKMREFLGLGHWEK